MKLVTSKGQLTLPSGLSFTIEENSPFFSREGTQSIPVTLPVSEESFAKLGHPTRVGRSAAFVRKLPAKLSCGVVHKDGQLVIDSSSSREGIVCALMLNESDFYTKIKDVKLKDVFSEIIRDDFSESSDKISDWYTYLYSIYNGTVTDDFTLFPVAVNLDTTTSKYQFLNEPDFTSALTPWALKWNSRSITADDKTVFVPPGYGITPFLYLRKLIELLFESFDYTVRSNPFSSHTSLSKIVVLNNCADTICKGRIKYSDIVPDCTVADFIDFLFNKFCCQVFVYPESKIIDIRLFEHIANEVPDVDITALCQRNPFHAYSDAKEINLIQDTTLDGALPASVTADELATKYNQVKEVNEDEFVNQAWQYALVLRKATGEYYEMMRKLYSESNTSRKLGTNYFNFFNNTLPEEKIEAKDICVPMISYQVGGIAAKKVIIVCPYIGSSIHYNTSYDSQNESGTQAIALCFAACMTEEDDLTAAKYFMGTTQKYNNLGNAWGSLNLTVLDLYNLCWKSYNEMLMNSTEKISIQVDYTIEQIMSFRMDKLKLYKGVRLLPVKRSYTIASQVTSNKSEFMRITEPVLTGTIPFFSEQLYGWEYESNIETILDAYSSYQRIEWSFISSELNDEFSYLPAPTQAQYLSGLQYYQASRPILILAFPYGDTVPDEFEEILQSGWRAVLL